jgi:hypothetical protein
MQNDQRVEEAKKLKGAERARAFQQLMNEGVILNDEYRGLVSLEDELNALGERFMPQPPQQRAFDRSIKEQEKAVLIEELRKLPWEEYRKKYDEYIKSGKITEEDILKAQKEGRWR